MESFVVVAEYDTPPSPTPGQPEGLAEEEEPMEPCEEQALLAPGPRDLGEPGLANPSRTSSRETRESWIKVNFSSRKLSLQERSPSVQSPSGNMGLNGRYIYPSLPYSPVTSPHSSPRLPRRPTIESHRVSITGLQVREATSRQLGTPFVSFLIVFKRRRKKRKDKTKKRKAKRVGWGTKMQKYNAWMKELQRLRQW